MDERVGDDAAQQAFGGKHALPAERPRQQSDEAGEKGDERDGADGFGIRRGDRPRAKPVERVHRQQRGQQKRRDTECLQREIGDNCADHADPVVRGLAGERSGRGVERGIEGRVRQQREDKEDREDENQEADELIEPPVGRRSKWASEIHIGVQSF